MDKRPFRIDPSKSEKNGQMHHGSWHKDADTNPNLRLRYLNLALRGDAIGHLSGHVPPEMFTHVMRELVSIDYDTPNWCEKCHLADRGYCRCDPACNE